jgi:chromosome segregation ATPase
LAESARVTSLDALARFRAFYADFGEQARLALSNAESDIQRTLWWLQNDRRQHWQMQIKRRDKILAQAKAELHSAELQSRDSRPSLILERKAVAKAERALEEARQKLEACRKWARVLEREIMLYKGQVQGLSGRLEREVPKGLGRLGNLMDHLDKYIRMNPTATAGPARSTTTEDEQPEDETAEDAT